MKPDFSYRIDGMFALILPESPAGEKAMGQTTETVAEMSGGQPMFEDPQEIVNRAWKKLGADMGFVWDSAGPGADDHSFFADAIEGRYLN